MDINEITNKLIEMSIDYAPKVLLAILTLFVGLSFIKYLIRGFESFFMKSGIDETLSKFLSSAAGIALKIMLLFSVAAMFGINTTSFVAIIGALMVGVGMALNGSLGHAASGVLLMIFKPFKVGDVVTIGGNKTTARVEAINAFNTTLKTLDNKRVIISNSNVTGNDIINISGQGTVGVELSFGISYNTSIDKAREIILEVGKRCPYILAEPKQGVVVLELADSSINLGTRPFCKSEHFLDTKFFMQEEVKKEFDKQGVNIPFNTMELFVKNVEN
jgi:small conductance mechanosensitive channel